MQTIIIGAGRGKRLGDLTRLQPKTFTQINGKRILDWILDAHFKNGNKDIVYISGYLQTEVKKEYPEFIYCHNYDWENNNVLESLFFAKEYFDNGFISTYSDILYTAEIVRKIKNHPGDIVIAIDTEWKDRYKNRTEHPETDAEKVRVENDRVKEINRKIDSKDAEGEFIGLAKFSSRGAQVFKNFYECLNKDFEFEGGIKKQDAYLIHYLNHLLSFGIRIDFVTTAGEYIEIDTLQDYHYAQKNWK